MSRVASLDLLRGSAAFLVAIPHFLAYHHVMPGLSEAVAILGVEIFFVLSGYVLAPQILMCLDGGGRALGVFLVRRWMRTVPAYLLALLCISALMSKLGSGDFFRYLAYVQNLVWQANEQDYFAIAWSLSVEEWFYVIFPAGLLGATMAAGRRDIGWIVGIAVAFIAIVTAARFLLGPADGWDAAVRRVVAFRVDSIAYGFLLYLLIQRVRPGLAHEIPAAAALAGVVVTGAAAIWVTLELEQMASRHTFPFVAAAFGCATVVAAVRAEHAVAIRTRLAQCGLFLGKVSYSVYLFHIIFVMVLAAALRSQPLAIQAALYVGGLLAFGAIFYATFERPILDARPDFSPPRQRTSSGTSEARA